MFHLKTVDTSALSASISSYRVSRSSFYAANSASIESSRSSESAYFSSVVASITANSPTVTTTPGECQGADDEKGVEVSGQCCKTGFYIDGKCYDAKGFNGSVIENNGVGTISEYGSGDDGDEDDSSSSSDTASTATGAGTSSVSSSPASATSSTPDGVSKVVANSSLLGALAAAVAFVVM